MRKLLSTLKLSNDKLQSIFLIRRRRRIRQINYKSHDATIAGTAVSSDVSADVSAAGQANSIVDVASLDSVHAAIGMNIRHWASTEAV